MRALCQIRDAGRSEHTSHLVAVLPDHLFFGPFVAPIVIR